MDRRRAGFTLVELLIVILILGLLAALLLPSLLPPMCQGRAALAHALIHQAGQAAQLYQMDFGVHPPGDGRGSRELVHALQARGPGRKEYLELRPDQLHEGHLVNPVWGAEGAPPSNLLHYRRNAGGPAKGGMPVQRKSSFDLWAAGCDFDPVRPATAWSLRFE